MLNRKNNSIGGIDKFRSGYSLTKLSVVILIISFIIVVIDGTISLIYNTQAMIIIHEMNKYKKIVNIFYLKKDRYPGDVTKIGRFGDDSGYKYDQYDFAELDFIPLDVVAPFIELYKENLIDFQPKGNDCEYTYNQKNAGIPLSKTLRKMYISYVYKYNNIFDKKSFLYNSPNGEYLKYYNKNDIYGAEPKIINMVDNKIDDGIHNIGSVRALCNGNIINHHYDYNKSQKLNKHCTEIHYYLSLNMK